MILLIAFKMQDWIVVLTMVDTIAPVCWYSSSVFQQLERGCRIEMVLEVKERKIGAKLPMSLRASMITWEACLTGACLL